ncbi:trypsin-like peptidase domain-containing protein [bacterium]|nr:trypsin-like peptidase domain-containing protein [bacterium]
MKHGFARTLPLLYLAVVTGLVSCKNITSKNSTLPTDLVKELADEKITRNIPSDCTIQEYSAEELFDKSKSGIAVVLTDSGVGSAFVVKHENKSTLLVTNAHVVQGNRAVTLKWSDDSQDQAAVVKLGDVQSLDNDLALLEVSGHIGKVLQVKQDKVNTGADIVAIGAPRGLEFTITRGIVSAHRDNGRVIQIDAPINPGNSGGAVLDKTGCVVGVATFIRRDSEGLAFAISSSQLQNFLVSDRETISNSQALGNRIAPTRPNARTNRKPKCWFQQEAGGELEAANCLVTSRKNNNGHLVYDLTENTGGLKRTIVLWEDKKSEVILNGRVYNGSWWTDPDGDIRVKVNGGVFAFVLPNSAESEKDLDRRTDTIFYERYPELKGKTLGSSKGRLAKEWINIRESLK